MCSAAMKGTTAMRGDRLSRMTLTVAFALLGGCSLVDGPASVATTGVSTVLLINTGKTLTDYALSYAMDEDCSMVNYEKTHHYCREWPEVTVRAEPELYCYKTLAQVECHPRPEPYGNKESLVGIRPAWPAPAVPPK
jgi:hypothetical protein